MCCHNWFLTLSILVLLSPDWSFKIQNSKKYVLLVWNIVVGNKDCRAWYAAHDTTLATPSRQFSYITTPTHCQQTLSQPNFNLMARLSWQWFQTNLSWVVPSWVLSWAVGVPLGRRSGGWLSTTLVATMNDIISLFLFSLSSAFLKEGVLGSKNLFSESCLECPKT